jgi:hypothetical protein
MAIQKEIWSRDIVEGLFPENSFASKAINDDAFVNEGKKVHVPNAGAPSGVKKNRPTVPASATKRVDTNVDYDLDEYTTDPICIPHADTVELSYDKRRSVISQDREELRRNAHEGLLENWAPKQADGIVYTSGLAKAAHLNKATGKRKALTTSDVLTLMTKFDSDNIPQEERYLLLDAVMYAELLESMTKTDEIGFLQKADAAKGVVGELYSFKVMKRSTVLRYAVSAGAATGLASTEAATDCAAGLAWHVTSVRRAIGEVTMFTSEDNPLYYGDIYSFLVRCGGCISRSDKKGVCAIVGITAE